MHKTELKSFELDQSWSATQQALSNYVESKSGELK